MKREPALPVDQRELITSPTLAAVLGVSRKKLADLRRDGLIPRPVDFIPGRHTYRVREVQAWVAAGMPPADRWKWKETLPQTLDNLIRLRTAEVERLERIIRELKPQADELDRLARAAGR